MAANQDRGALEDLEAMLDRSLKIQQSPPRWHPTYQNTPAHAPANPALSPTRGAPPTATSPSARSNFGQSPNRVYPARVPVPASSFSPSAQQPQAISSASSPRSETRAVPVVNAPLGMRASSSQHSLVAPEAAWEQRQQQAAAEAQRQQQILMQQQSEQHRIEMQRHERLRRLQEQQYAQQQELERLRQREAYAQQQRNDPNEYPRSPERHPARTHENEVAAMQMRQNQFAQQQQQQQQQQQYQQQQQNNQFAQHQQHQHQHELSHQHAQYLREQQIAQEQLAREREQFAQAQFAREQQIAEQIRADEEFARETARQEAILLQRQEEEERERARQEAVRAAEEAEKERQRQEIEHEEEIRRAEAARLRHQQFEQERSREAQLEREGAATMVQRTQDSKGNVTTRVVKKGVEDFEFKDELGAGSYSTVVAAQDKQTLRQYAIKVLDKAHIIKEQKVKYVEIEKHTLNRLGDHPGIIRLYFTFQDRQSLYFVLDFAPNGELLHLIKRIGSLNEDCARYYACQLLDAIEYMHAKGVIHRDLKPENILLDYKMRIKITDFGTAKLLEPHAKTGEYPVDARANSFVGTAEYVSPELLVGKSQGKSADLWAWGCVLYQMIAAAPPFQGNTQYLTFQKIARLQYSIPPGFPFVVRDLLRHVLVKAQQRWTIDEIKSHEFFENQDWSRKALWSSPPPRLLPYKASVASMKPRPVRTTRQPQKVHRPAPTRPYGAAVKQAQSQHANNTSSSHSSSSGSSQGTRTTTTTQQPQQQQQQVFVPTSAGLQALNPSTLYGMPVSINRSTDQLSSRPAASKPASAAATASSGVLANKPKRTNPSSQSASSSVYKTAPAPTSSYQQSQERINALTRRMQEQRSGRAHNGQSRSVSSPTGSPVGNPNSPAGAAAAASSPNLDSRNVNSSGGGANSTSTTTTGTVNNTNASMRITSPSPPMSPQLPFLAQPPLTQIESQYSNILVSAQERILKHGRMSLLVSTHLPPQAQPRDENGKIIERNDTGNKSHSRGRSSVEVDRRAKEDEVDVVFSYEDDNLFSKLFLTKNKSRLVIVTTCGRLLIMADERKVLFEVPLGVPQIEVNEVPFKTQEGRSTKIVVQTYNKVLTLDDPGHIHEWIAAIELSKRYYAQLTADQERNAFNAAAAAASAVAGRRR